jgi:hypothetical protein
VGKPALPVRYRGNGPEVCSREQTSLVAGAFTAVVSPRPSIPAAAGAIGERDPASDL